MQKFIVSDPMKKRMWTVAGFLIAPIVPAATMAIWGSLLEQRPVGLTVQMTLFLYFYTAFATIVFGIPAYFFLLRCKLVNSWSALTMGFVMGAIIGSVIKLPNLAKFHEILSIGAMGAATALTFWLIWRRGQRSK